MRSEHKKITYEDKFDRKYACYFERAKPKIKRINNKKARRIFKEEIAEKDLTDY